MVSNNWWHPTRKRREALLHDPGYPLLGVPELVTEDDNTPRGFTATTVGDQLIEASHGKSRVVTIAAKDRAAVLLGGQKGKAYWYSETTGAYTTSTWYQKELPTWVTAINARRVPDSFFGKKWERMLPEESYQAAGPDDVKFEADVKGLGRTFPHPVNGKLDKPGPDFYEAYATTPWANDLELELARAAIENEHLGQGEATDVLGISLTANDYIGHTFGPDSQEVMDVTVATDRQIAGFLEYLRQRFKPDELLLVVTADHGACPIPEAMAARGTPAGRIRKATLRNAINKALGERFGQAEWVLALEDPSVYLNQDRIKEKGLDPAEVQKVAGEAVLPIPGVATYYTRTQFTRGGLPDTVIARKYARSFNVQRSGDVLVVTRPYYFWGKYGEKDGGSTHGSPYAYDAHVPLLLVGPWFRAGEHKAPVDMSDLAATLCKVLDIPTPAHCEGRPITRILK